MNQKITISPEKQKHIRLFHVSEEPDITEEFTLQDSVAGYYVAATTQYPKEKYVLTDLFSELAK